mgnify:CR=1 FL=1
MGFDISGDMDQVFQNNPIVASGKCTVLVGIDFLDIKKNQRRMGKKLVQGFVASQTTGIQRGMDTQGADLFQKVGHKTVLQGGFSTRDGYTTT